MRILVAGATGVIGRRVIPLLLMGGHQVTGVCRTAEKRLTLKHQGAHPVLLDLFDTDQVRRAVEGCDVVVNLATHIPPVTRMLLPGAWLQHDRLRREASANLVAAALAGGVKRFIQESFAGVYPDRGAEWVDEGVPPQPVRRTRSALDAEQATARFSRSGGTGVTLRFAAFYGPDAGHVHHMIAMVRRGWAALPGSPAAFVSSVSHDDAASAVVAALEAPAGVYNVGDDEPLTRRAYFAALAAELGVAAPRIPPAWAGRLAGPLGAVLSRSVRVSNRKLRARNWAPQYPSAREGWRAVIEALGRAPGPTGVGGTGQVGNLTVV